MEDARKQYADIIDLPHHQSADRPHMSLYDRAAQFAPFAALVGYDDMVREEARLTSSKQTLSESEADVLNRQFARLSECLERGEHPEMTVSYFVADRLKDGGRYVTTTAMVKSVDSVYGNLLLFGSDNVQDKRIQPIEIPIGNILKMEGEVFEE